MRWTLWLVQDEGKQKRTAKARGPDPPTLGSSRRESFRRRWWLKSPAHQGERAISRKPSRRECRIVRRTCGDLLACFFLLHARLRVRPTPGIPCALSDFEGDAIAKLGQNLPRECGRVSLSSLRGANGSARTRGPMTGSATKQSMPPARREVDCFASLAMTTV
jgi:hypothetical protein